MKKLFLIGACLLALASSPALAQVGGPPVVVVQLYYSGLGTGHIAVTRGEGKTEDIEYKATTIKQHVASETYQRVFTQLYQEGYALKSTFSPGDGSVVTLIFDKK
jgi:hypothetical protein